MKLLGILWNSMDSKKDEALEYIKKFGNVIYWDDIPEAGCYVVCLDRKIIAFTTQTRFTIPSLREGACYSVRSANWYGGLGPRSKDIVYPFKESK